MADDGRGGLRFGVLGPFEASWNGHPLSLGGAKQQMVLAALALDANQVVSIDRILEWVWQDDATPKHGATLQVYVSNLRRLLDDAAEALGRQLIVTKRPGYVLELADDESDLLEFQALRREAAEAVAAGRVGQGALTYRLALGLWRGEPLSGLPLGHVATGALERLELARLAVAEKTAETELAVGHHREILDELQSWVREHPLDERLRGHLMLALYRSGRQAEALAAFREAREALVEELGIDPSRALRELETQILNQDPALDLRPRHRADFEVESTHLRTTPARALAALDHAGGSVTIDRPVFTFGRLPDRDLVLDDADVSRSHGELRRSGRSFRVIDTGSANGTFVNGVPVTDHVLADGDVIRVGDTELTFRQAGE